MSDSYGIFTRTIKPGVPEKVQHGGKFVHILKSDGNTDVVLQTDTGDKITLPPGHGLPVTFNFLMVDAPNGANPTNVVLYIGNVPLNHPTVVQGDRTMFACDTLTVAGKGGLTRKQFLLAGKITFNGVKWRRKSALISNTDAANDLYLESPNQVYAGAGFLDGTMIPHGNEGTPIPVETDDDIYVGNYNAAAVQFRVASVWIRDY